MRKHDRWRQLRFSTYANWGVEGSDMHSGGVAMRSNSEHFSDQ